MELYKRNQAKLLPSFLAVPVLLLFVVFVGMAVPVSAQTVPATVPAGTSPAGVAVNPATNKIYVANSGDFVNPSTVTVIDGATNATTTVTVGTWPAGVAVNPVTNKIYVTNRGDQINPGTVTVIDGATDTVLTTVVVGVGPGAVAVNPVTNRIYVANITGGSVTVIDGATNTVIATVAALGGPFSLAVNPVTNKVYVASFGDGVNPSIVTVIDGATNATTVVTVGVFPVDVAVNPVTNRIYVANGDSDNVTVIDGATNATTTVAAGIFPRTVAVNPVTNKIYVTNRGDKINPGTVTVIDGATNTTATVTVGIFPRAVVVNPATNQVYVTDSGDFVNPSTVTVIDGATNTTATLAAGIHPFAVAVNPVTNKAYVANRGDEINPSTVTVIDGATNNFETVAAGVNPNLVAVNPGTNKIYVVESGVFNPAPSTVTVIDGLTNSIVTLPIGAGPSDVAINPVTNKIYITNRISNTVTVIDGATDTVAATVTLGSVIDLLGGPWWVVVNPVTNKVYVATFGELDQPSNLTVIDGATDSVEITIEGIFSHPRVNPVTNRVYVIEEGLSVINGTTNTVVATVANAGNGLSPIDIAINPATNMVYVLDNLASNIVVVDGTTNTFSAVIPVGSRPTRIAVNPVTNKIYVTNSASHDVTVIDGATNTVEATVAVGFSPQTLAVNPVTNKIYVPITDNSFVIPGTLTIIDGATNTTTTLTAGSETTRVAVNPANNKVYISNILSGTVTILAEQEVQAIPLTTAITPFLGNVTQDSTPTFTFTTTSTYAPIAPPVQQVYFQMDTWQGEWQTTTGAAPNFTGVSPSLLVGEHVVYAFATDGQDSTTIGQSQSLIGQIAAYPFLVGRAGTSTGLVSDFNPSTVGATVNLIATVTTDEMGQPVPTGTVEFFDGAASLGSVALDGGGSAMLSTAALADGTHSLTAVYGGDNTFNGSASAVLEQHVLEPMTVRLVSDINPALTGDTVTFTATVTSASGTLVGNFKFFNNAALLGIVALDGFGMANFATSTLTLGSHSITGVFFEDGTVIGRVSTGVTQEIVEIILTTPPIHGFVVRGGPADFDLTLKQGTTVTNPVTFSCSGLPQGAACIFNPASVAAGTPSASVALTIATAQNVMVMPQPGPYPPLWLFWAMGLLSLAGLVWSLARNRRKLVPVLGLLLLMLSLVSCGGGGGAIGPNGPTGTFNITVTGTSGTVTGQTAVTLTVTP